MLAGSLMRSGYYFGPRLYPARASNPKGFFESPVVNSINEKLLQTVLPRRSYLSTRFSVSTTPGHAQRWLARVPLDRRVTVTPRLNRRIVEFTERCGFCYKDPRFSYTLDSWRVHAPDAAFICVFRHPSRTVASILRECRDARYLHTLRTSRDDALEVWRLMYLHVLRRHATCGDWLFLHFDQLMSGDGLDSVQEFLGVAPDRSFPDASLARATQSQPISREIQQVYDELCERARY